MIGETYWLWRKAKRGDPAACEALLQSMYGPIYAYLGRLCRHTETAQDLTQEAFARVWKSLPSQRRFGEFRAWVYRIARNVWLDHCRRKGSTQAMPDEWWAAIEDPQPLPSATAEVRDMAGFLWRAVQELDEERKSTIILHYCQNLSLRETAIALGVATSTVKYRLREALKLLRERIDTSDPAARDENALRDRSIQQEAR